MSTVRNLSTAPAASKRVESGGEECGLLQGRGTRRQPSSLCQVTKRIDTFMVVLEDGKKPMTNWGSYRYVQITRLGAAAREPNA